MESLVKTDQKGYALDTESGAVLNTDEGDWIRYQSERNKNLEFTRMKKDISDLKQRVEYLERLIQEKLR